MTTKDNDRVETEVLHCGECDKIVLYELLNDMCGPCHRRYIERQRRMLP